jgi:hypothetical protein
MIECIQNNNRINIAEIIKTNIFNLIWLQEIYIHFGWYDQLRIFYKDITKIEVSLTEKKIIFWALYRFNSICKLIGIEGIKIKLDQVNNSRDIEGEFLNHLINSTDQLDGNIYEQIQKKWNYLHIPAIRLKLQKLIHENPDELIALAYLALQYRFWWYQKLEDLLLQFLPENKKSIFKFLSLINNSNTVRFRKDSIYFSKYNTSLNVRVHKNLAGLLTIKDTTQGGEHFTYLEKENTFFFKINKSIDLVYFPRSSSFIIRPRLYHPYTDKCINCKIKISEYSVDIPLIWDQFTIEFKKCRFKFLRKKDRFQVTIKFSKSVQCIKLNEDHIETNSEPVHKLYIPIKRSKSKIHVSMYNEYGASIHKLNPKSANIILNGYGYDTYGVLNSHYRIYMDKQKKSFEGELNDPVNLSMLQCNKSMEIVLRASKFDPVHIQLNHVDPLIAKLAYTNISELFYRLKIFVDEDNKTIDKIINVCNRNLGFIPQIENLSKLIPDRNNIVIIIGKSFRDEESDVNLIYKIIPINDKSKQTALWINPVNLNNLFSETFFKSIFE